MANKTLELENTVTPEYVTGLSSNNEIIGTITQHDFEENEEATVYLEDEETIETRVLNVNGANEQQVRSSNPPTKPPHGIQS